jgi:hypothetical protein
MRHFWEWEWEWDPKGHFWFNCYNGVEMTPQELMEEYQDLKAKHRKAIILLSGIKNTLHKKIKSCR